MFLVNILNILLALFCYGIHNVSLKDIFIRQSGNDKNNICNWTLPCRSLRHAVKISSSDDVIHINHSFGIAYEECEHFIGHDSSIVLKKSLTFRGFGNGTPIVSCAQRIFLFTVKSTQRAMLKLVISNLALHCSFGGLLRTNYNSSRFELMFNKSFINYCDTVITAKSLSCSVQVMNTNILGSSYLKSLIRLECRNLTAHFNGSNFFVGHIELFGADAFGFSIHEQRRLFDVFITDCTFENEWSPSPTSLITMDPELTNTYKIVVQSTEFWNFLGVGKQELSTLLMIDVHGGVKNKTVILLDNLTFENIVCDSGAVYFRSAYDEWKIRIYGIEIGIYNSKFINTTRSLTFNSNEVVKIYNSTFINVDGIIGETFIELSQGGLYLLRSCYFQLVVPTQNQNFQIIRIKSSANAEFQNMSFINEKAKGRVTRLNSNVFIIASFDSATRTLTVNQTFTILCPIGYDIVLKAECIRPTALRIMACTMFLASCEQCPRKTYSLGGGELHFNMINHTTCHNCPVGGNCAEGQVTSKPNFWGYVSNRTVKFLQCPPKYCCDEDHCKRYDSCHANRIGTLCGKCPTGMSESLFDTKCKRNEDCTSGTFWPGVSAFLILYLVFFLFQEDIMNFLQRRIIPRCFLSYCEGQNYKPGGLLKILFYYFQVANVLKNSIDFGEKVKYFDIMENILFRALNFILIDIPSFDCPFQNLRPVEKAMVVHSVGYSLLILLCLVYFFTYLCRIFQMFRSGPNHRSASYTRTMDYCFEKYEARMAGAFANISLLTYNSSTQLCLSLLHCVPVGNRKVLFLDGNINCYKTFQYFLLAYMIFSILPFCLVPVLGSYLLHLDRIPVTQFCLACIFPLPFCCYWTYLLVRNSWWDARPSCHVGANENAPPMIEDDQVQNDITDVQPISSARLACGEIVNGNLSSDAELGCCKSAILGVLVGPFRSHKATVIFPSSRIPWEGFLILRRLALIVVLTFVYDYRVKAMLSMILCVIILLPHVFVWPFKTTSDNVLETISLGTLIIISGLGLIRAIYFGQDLDSRSLSLLGTVDLVENILIFSPVALIFSSLIFSILFKLVVMFRFCFQAFLRRLILFKNRPSQERLTDE